MGRGYPLLVVGILVFAAWDGGLHASRAEEASRTYTVVPEQGPTWEHIRQGQPPGVDLKLILPKTTFFQGELIPATLEFSNHSAVPYAVWRGSYDRSGRLTDTSFHARDSRGNLLPDPLDWYFKKRFLIIGRRLFVFQFS